MKYAAYDFETDPNRFGLIHRVIGSPLGPLDVYVTSYGRPSLLVFLHGLNGSWQSWTPMLTAAQNAHPAVLTDNDLLVLDLRRLNSPRSSAELEMLMRTIRTLPGPAQQLHLLGHSTGGSLAMAMAAEGSAQIRSVRLVSGGFIALFDEVRTAAPHPLAADTTRRAMGQFRVLACLGPVIPLALNAAARTGRLAALASGMYWSSDQLPTRILGSIRTNYDGRTLRRTISMGRTYDYERTYGAVTAPVLSIVGAADPLVAPGDADRLANLVPDLRQVVIPEAGHFAHIEQPDRVAELLLSELSRSSTS